MLMNRDHVGIEVIPMIRDIIDLKELNSKVKHVLFGVIMSVIESYIGDG